MPSLALSQAQQAEFEQNGFLVIENALTQEEIHRYTTIVDRLESTVTVDVNGNPRKPGETLEVRDSITKAPDLLPLLTHESAFPAVVDLMGYNIALTTSHVFVRPPSPPGTAREFKAISWHHDGPGHWARPVNGRLPWLYTKIGYFLTDLQNPDAGALRVVPGSHRSAGRPAWKPGAPDPYGYIELHVKAGTAVIFENRLWHAVGPNYSNVPRKNIYLGYCWRWMRPIDYLQPAEDLLARCNPIERQLVGDVKSSLGFILPQDEDVPLKAWVEQRLDSAREVV